MLDVALKVLEKIEEHGFKAYIVGGFVRDYLLGNVHTYEGSLKTPVTIPEGCVFVMGDNREHSKDSRDMSVGIIRNEQIVGKAVLQIYPFAEFGVVK